MVDRIFPAKDIMFGDIWPSVPHSRVYTVRKDITNHIAADQEDSHGE